jgi:hypothetical protein
VPNRLSTPFLTTLLICAAALSASAPAASASRESREARRAAHQAVRAAREAQRDARQAERAQLRREREELRAARAAERAGDGATKTEGASGEGADVHPAPVAPSAGGPGHATCAISAGPNAHSVTIGEAVTISGKLSCPAPEEASGQNVTVYLHEPGGPPSARTVVSNVTTAEDGSYQFHSAGLTSRSTFLLKGADTPRRARVDVQVDAGISLQGPAASGASLTMWNGHLARSANVADFSGTVEPQAAGTGVALKVRYGNGAWHRVAVTQTDAQGNFSFHHRFRYAGAVSVIAVTRPRGEHRTASPELNYTIVQAQNPALTIGQPTTPPAALAPAPGQTGLAQAPVAPEPTTIAGIASAGGGHTVTLLSRALGSGNFTRVATTVSDASGAYSFTVAPNATTVYEVASGGQHSTPLRIEVS